MLKTQYTSKTTQSEEKIRQIVAAAVVSVVDDDDDDDDDDNNNNDNKAGVGVVLHCLGPSLGLCAGGSAQPCSRHLRADLH